MLAYDSNIDIELDIRNFQYKLNCNNLISKNIFNEFYTNFEVNL